MLYGAKDKISYERIEGKGRLYRDDAPHVKHTHTHTQLATVKHDLQNCNSEEEGKRDLEMRNALLQVSRTRREKEGLLGC